METEVVEIILLSFGVIVVFGVLLCLKARRLPNPDSAKWEDANKLP